MSGPTLATKTRSCRHCGGTGKEIDWRAMGRRVRAVRLDRGIGLRELARHVKCSPTYIVDLEAGRRGAGLGPKTRRVLRVLEL